MDQDNSHTGEVRRYEKDGVIFREGDEGMCMFEILRGRVGIYAGERLLKELCPGETFGEMAMIEALPRSATATALEAGTELRPVTWDTLGAYFRDRPSRVVAMMQQMGRRIRELTEDYIGACRTIAELTERAEQKRQEAPPKVDPKLRRYLDAYNAYRTR